MPCEFLLFGANWSPWQPYISEVFTTKTKSSFDKAAAPATFKLISVLAVKITVTSCETHGSAQLSLIQLELHRNPKWRLKNALNREFDNRFWKPKKKKKPLVYIHRINVSALHGGIYLSGAARFLYELSSLEDAGKPEVAQVTLTPPPLRELPAAVTERRKEKKKKHSL